jgi:hypothetical protein
MSVASRVQVNLEVSSWIEGRGVRHTNWSVRVNDAWIPIAELRDVGRTATDPELSFYDDDVDESRVLPPGCQYRITYHPRLPVGTQIQKRVSVPLVQPPVDKRGPEDANAAFARLLAMGSSPKLPLKTTFTDLRVTARGLVSEERWQRRQQRLDQNGSKAPRSRQTVVASEAVGAAELQAFTQRLGKAG